MMKKGIILPVLVSAFVLGLSSCQDFLGTQPDDRINDIEQIKTADDIHKLLVTAYPNIMPNLIAEYYSDNVIQIAENTKYSTRFEDQVYSYSDVTEPYNESPKDFWQSAYDAVHTANKALDEIDRLGNGQEFDSAKGEALLCRAFGHFALVNIFTHGYRGEAQSKLDLGIPYQTKPETTLNPSYTRESVYDNFKHIEADLVEGLKLNKESAYKSYLKYHFNDRAANAFATRFYLYYQQWDKVIEYADKVLGDDPKLRNYTTITALPSGTEGIEQRAIETVSPSQDDNLLLLSLYSALGQANNTFYLGLRYNHSNYMAEHETFYVDGPWDGGKLTRNQLQVPPVSLPEPYVKAIVPRYPLLTEYTNKAIGSGYWRTTSPEFTTDEVLLSRAEAYIMTQQYEKALVDMNKWLANYTKGVSPITDATLKSWSTRVAYSTPSAPTPRKVLHPSFSINEEQEQYLQACLHLRRMETIHTGLRWYDVKRYGIEITRTTLTAGSAITVTSNVLTTNDPRRAVQIPSEVIAAGMQPTPRN